MKRNAHFIVTNNAVLVVVVAIVSLLGVGRIADAEGLNLGAPMAFTAIVGFTGAVISLLISKPMTKRQTGAQRITKPTNAEEHWLRDTVGKLSAQAGITRPEGARYGKQKRAYRIATNIVRRFQNGRANCHLGLGSVFGVALRLRR